MPAQTFEYDPTEVFAEPRDRPRGTHQKIERCPHGFLLDAEERLCRVPGCVGASHNARAGVSRAWVPIEPMERAPAQANSSRLPPMLMFIRIGDALDELDALRERGWSRRMLAERAGVVLRRLERFDVNTLQHSERDVLSVLRGRAQELVQLAPTPTPSAE